MKRYLATFILSTILRGDTLLIIISGSNNVARIFSGKPSEATFTTKLPGHDPKRQLLAIKYEE